RALHAYADQNLALDSVLAKEASQLVGPLVKFRICKLAPFKLDSDRLSVLLSRGFEQFVNAGVTLRLGDAGWQNGNAAGSGHCEFPFLRKAGGRAESRVNGRPRKCTNTLSRDPCNSPMPPGRGAPALIERRLDANYFV